MNEESLSPSSVRDLLHPSEMSAFTIALLVSSIVGLIAALLVLFSLGAILIYVALIIGILWVVMKIIMASYMGNFVKISEQNFPEIFSLIEKRKKQFRVNDNVEVFLSQDGQFNAFIIALFGMKVILLPSEILLSENKKEVDYIVSRFIGAIAARHYRFSLIEILIGVSKNIAFLNLFILPYYRATQLSGDRLALYAIGGDIETALNAHKKLMAGTHVAKEVSLTGLVSQCDGIHGSFFAWVAKMLSPFPHMVIRISELLQFAARRYPDKVCAIQNIDSNWLSRKIDVNLPSMPHVA